jgi:transcriptional regulator with XRE-family HTH domain
VAADPLTLASLGVDFAGLARRIGIAQDRANRTDDDCAALAGVSAETFRGWKDGSVVPGVARMPRLATAVSAPVSWLMYEADRDAVMPANDAVDAIKFARRAAQLLTEAVPHVEALHRIATEVARDSVPLAGGEDLAGQLGLIADVFTVHAAVLSDRNRVS